MATFDFENAEDMLQLANRLPRGEAKLRICMEAARLADAQNDIDQAFLARYRVVEDALWIGHPEAQLPAFSWCLQKLKEDRQRFGYAAHTITWCFKHTLSEALCFPEIQAEQIEALIVQMAAWYEQEGYNQRPVYHQRAEWALHRGKLEEARLQNEKMYAIPRDGMADCAACEADQMIRYYDEVDDYESVMQKAEPALEGRISCAEVPHRTLGYVLRSLALLGRYEEADAFHKRGLRMISNNQRFVGHLPFHLFYLLHRGEVAKALKIVERHLHLALATHALNSRHFFYLAFRRVLEAMLEKKGARKSRQFNLPPEFPLYDPTGKYEVQSLYDWFLTAERELAARFDRRNGTDDFSRRTPAHNSY